MANTNEMPNGDAVDKKAAKKAAKLAKKEEIFIDHVFCIAVEEMEAWLLGDRNALRAAYANVADRISSKL